MQQYDDVTVLQCIYCSDLDIMKKLLNIDNGDVLKKISAKALKFWCQRYDVEGPCNLFWLPSDEEEVRDDEEEIEEEQQLLESANFWVLVHN